MEAENWSMMLRAAIFGIIGGALLYRFAGHRSSVLTPLTEWLRKAVASSARSVNAAPAIAPLLVLGIALGSLALAANALHWQTMSEIFFGGSFLVFLTAGIADVYHIAATLIKKLWARAMGKLFSIALNIIMAACSLALAKTATQSINGENPNNFTEYLAILAALVAPLVYGLAAAGVLTMLAVGQLLLVIVYLIIMGTSRRLEIWAPERYRAKITAWRTSLMPPAASEAPSKIFRLHEVSLIVRPFASITLATALAILSSTLLEFGPTAKPLLTKMLVTIEYRTHSRCMNAGDLPAAYVGDGFISVAIAENSGYRFERRPCDPAGQPAAPVP